MADDGKMPLPPGWIRGFSNSQQKTYYSHKDTKHTQWHFPTASEAADPWLAKRRVEENEQRMRMKMKRKQEEEESGTGGGVSKKPRQSSSSSPDGKTPPPAASAAAASSSKSSSSSHGIVGSNTGNDDDDLSELTNVAIVVPFRDLHAEQKRAAHLSKFIPHMLSFLQQMKSKKMIYDYHIYIVEQSNDERKFNRGKLLNIGFDYARKKSNSKVMSKLSKKKHDVYIFHDVDLLPQPPLDEAYARFPSVPHHIARVWDRYSNNPKYFGGIVSFSASDFKRINGYPNTFWGWGGEDDELQLRCNALGIKWDWPRNPKYKNTVKDLEEMNVEEKMKFLKQHQEWKCLLKREVLDEHAKTWKSNGLSSLQGYQVLKEQPLDTKDVARSKATKITVDVKLNGTEWSNKQAGIHLTYKDLD